MKASVQRFQDNINLIERVFLMISQSFNHHKPVLIINADDVGVTPSIDQGVVELLSSRKVSSLSVIVNEVNSLSAAQKIMSLNGSHPHIFQETSIGLHFNLTRGEPLSLFMRKSGMVHEGKFQKKSEVDADEEAISDEFRRQVKRFMEMFKRRPSHVDSHNHLHLLTKVAKAIAQPMRELGIYRIRLPNSQDLKDQNLKKDLENVRRIYGESSLIWPQVFLGGQDSGNLQADKIRTRIVQQGGFGSFQLMCHPGYPSQGGGWNSQKQRLNEKEQLESAEFETLVKEVQGLGSYFDLQVGETGKHVPRLLIYSKLERGTGNYTTTMRLKTIFETFGYQVYTWSVQNTVDPEIQTEDLAKFLMGFGISLILGVNVSRSARIIHAATHSEVKVHMQVPYILVVAGTDANYTFQGKECEQMKEYLKWSQCIVSISKGMAATTQTVLKRLGVSKNVYTIVQSSNLEGDENKADLQHPYILFPTSFRRIKCVEHVFKELNHIITTYGVDVIVAGPIIEQDYYEKVSPHLGRIQYLGTLSQKNYAKKLSGALLVINCSETEGMSCSILQAFQFGVPVLARSNDGNQELVGTSNGLLYDTPEDFLAKFQQLHSDPTLRSTLIKNGHKAFVQSYSFQKQMREYETMIEKEVRRKMMQLNFENHYIRIYNEFHVHPTSQVNTQLYRQIRPTPTISPLSILDLGCGASVFSLVYLLQLDFTRGKLYLVDITNEILGNALFNCRQSSLWGHLEIITICETDFFKKAQKELKFDTILFNPPQTPFQYHHNRLDKNGGTNGVRFYEQVLSYFARTSSRELYLLHSHLAWPSRLFELMASQHLECKWRSELGLHRIKEEQYELMESGLTAFIMQHWRQGRASISLSDGVFTIPAEILQIVKK